MLVLNKALFEEYNNQVRNGWYKKIKYKEWVALKHGYDSSTSFYGYPIQLNYDRESVLVGDIEFSIHDDALGTFLFDKFQNLDKKETTKNMNTVVNFDFGKVNDLAVRMSAYGLAIKNTNGVFVAYDKANDTIMDVDIFNIDSDNMFYKVPVALKDIAEGDIVIHNRVPMFVQKVLNESKSLKVIDPKSGERKEIMPTRNYFGFDFMTKIISIIDFCGGIEADAENPFGNLLPLLMMGNHTNNVVETMLMFNMMNNKTMDMASNPMLMMVLLSDNHDTKNLLPIMMMSQMNKKIKPKTE